MEQMKKLGIGKFENQVRTPSPQPPRAFRVHAFMWAPPHLSRDLHSPSSSLPRPHTQEDQDDDDAPGTGPAHHDTGAGITNDAWCPPDGWIEAPPQGAIVRDVFVPSKAPLSDTWHADGRVPSHRRYGPHEALDMAKQASGGRSVELVIDLTNSSRYYDPAVFDARGASYVKIGKFLYISVFFLFSYGRLD